MAHPDSATVRAGICLLLMVTVRVRADGVLDSVGAGSIVPALVSSLGTIDPSSPEALVSSAVGLTCNDQVKLNMLCGIPLIGLNFHTDYYCNLACKYISCSPGRCNKGTCSCAKSTPTPSTTPPPCNKS